ncbi:MAG: glycogen debranching enzyme family protein [Verrucomicrobia bacterium]|nr:glycogen debranching enzyme family protein [Verrucomicrobiota bacterium]
MDAGIRFGHDLCSVLEFAERREWLVTNGRGSYASGTVANVLTRGYHGLLIAALAPPVGRTLTLVKFDESVTYRGSRYELFTNRWQGGAVAPAGHVNLESFHLEGTVPTWRFAVADAVLEKRIWMEPWADTTYLAYNLIHACEPIEMACKAIVDYRDYHGRTHAGRFDQVQVDRVDRGLKVTMAAGARPLLLLSNAARGSPVSEWYHGFELARERERGLQDYEDHLHVADFQAKLALDDEPLVFAASVEGTADPDITALERRRAHENGVIDRWATGRSDGGRSAAGWVRQSVLAADQFIVDRANPADAAETGKTVIAGYHWFADWGRDTMISLPGLTLCTGRADIARLILKTFARYVSQGMLPNTFPDSGSSPEYNTVDATLWYFQALWAYYLATKDRQTVSELFPVLKNIVDWYRRGTRFSIHVDASDGLVYAGQEGVQLTWMDAKVGNWVVTPRIGKPIEVNALWYNALRILGIFASLAGENGTEFEKLAGDTLKGFQRFWNAASGYCFDVLDGPGGNDPALRPNQVFAVCLPGPSLHAPELLSGEQQRGVLDACAAKLLTLVGLRSLDPASPQYRGDYFGDRVQRDAAYHQGTVWAWLKGPFIEAHLRIRGDLAHAEQLLQPMADSLVAAGVGTLSEIYDGNAPTRPRGCIAQAWSVAELLRIWTLIEDSKTQGSGDRWHSR